MAAEPGNSEINRITENTTKKSEIVQKLLEPTTEVDQAGFRRRVYRYGDVTFSFRGREELPVIPSSTSSASVKILGSEPIHTKKDKYEEYRKSLKKDTTGSGRHFVVSKDLQGVVELAVRLGAQDESLNVMLGELGSGTYSGRALDLVDRLVAANCIADNKDGWGEKLTGSDAEAVVVLSLLGNSGASDYLDSKLEQMKKMDAVRQKEREQFKKDNGYEAEDDFPKLEDYRANPDELACVHATNYQPVVNEDGVYEVRTLADATNFKYVRNTVHVAINHKVLSHMMGNWGGSANVLISPMKEMVRVNGAPTSYQEHDTWWTRNPGETLKFPNCFLVKPGDMPFNTLFVIGEKGASFKGGDYTISDFADVEKLIGYSLNSLESFQEVFSPYDSETHELLGASWDMEKLSQKLVEKYFPNEGYLNQRKEKSNLEIFHTRMFSDEDVEKFDSLFTEPADIGISDRIRILLEDAGVRDAFSGKEGNYEEALKELVLLIAKKIESDVYEKLSSLVVAESISRMGYEAIHGGVHTSSHAMSAYHWLTHGHNYAVEQASEVIGESEDGNKIFGNFDWKKFNPSWKNLPGVDIKTRRVVYASGSFNSREE